MERYTVINVEGHTFANGSATKLSLKNTASEDVFVLVFNNSPLAEKVKSFKAGNIVELELKKEGKYTNLVNVGEIISSNEKSEVQPNKPYSKMLSDQTDSIQRQTSMKCAVELVTGSGIKFKTVEDATNEALKAAESFYAFISNIKESKEEV